MVVSLPPCMVASLPSRWSLSIHGGPSPSIGSFPSMHGGLSPFEVVPLHPWWSLSIYWVLSFHGGPSPFMVVHLPPWWSLSLEPPGSKSHPCWTFVRGTCLESGLEGMQSPNQGCETLENQGRNPSREREAPENQGWSPRKNGEGCMGRELDEPLSRIKKKIKLETELFILFAYLKQLFEIIII